MHGQVANLASHVNGNHVIQRCLQCFPEAYCKEIYEEIIENTVQVGHFSD